MALATAVKRFGLADVLVRRNPVLYARAVRSIRALENESHRKWIDQRLADPLRRDRLIVRWQLAKPFFQRPKVGPDVFLSRAIQKP